MVRPHHPSTGVRPGGGARPARRRGRLSLGAGAIAAGLAIGACGSGSASSLVLNTGRIEVAIEQAALAQRAKRIDVSCPSGVPQKKGVVFTCTAVYRGGRGTFTVTELDGAGDVHYVAA